MASKTTNRFSPEVRTPAVRLVFEHEKDHPWASATPTTTRLAETINRLYRAEVVHRREPWRTFEAVEFATLEWVDGFNKRWLLEPIGFMPTAEAEERYFAMLNDPAMAA